MMSQSSQTVASGLLPKTHSLSAVRGVLGRPARSQSQGIRNHDDDGDDDEHEHNDDHDDDVDMDDDDDEDLSLDLASGENWMCLTTSAHLLASQNFYSSYPVAPHASIYPLNLSLSSKNSPPPLNPVAAASSSANIKGSFLMIDVDNQHCTVKDIRLRPPGTKDDSQQQHDDGNNNSSSKHYRFSVCRRSGVLQLPSSWEHISFTRRLVHLYNGDRVILWETNDPSPEAVPTLSQICCAWEHNYQATVETGDAEEMMVSQLEVDETQNPGGNDDHVILSSDQQLLTQTEVSPRQQQQQQPLTQPELDDEREKTQPEDDDDDDDATIDPRQVESKQTSQDPILSAQEDDANSRPNCGDLSETQQSLRGNLRDCVAIASAIQESKESLETPKAKPSASQNQLRSPDLLDDSSTASADRGTGNDAALQTTESAPLVEENQMNSSTKKSLNSILKSPSKKEADGKLEPSHVSNAKSSREKSGAVEVSSIGKGPKERIVNTDSQESENKKGPSGSVESSSGDQNICDGGDKKTYSSDTKKTALNSDESAKNVPTREIADERASKDDADANHSRGGSKDEGIEPSGSVRHSSVEPPSQVGNDAEEGDYEKSAHGLSETVSIEKCAKVQQGTALEDSHDTPGDIGSNDVNTDSMKNRTLEPDSNQESKDAEDGCLVSNESATKQKNKSPFEADTIVNGESETTLRGQLCNESSTEHKNKSPFEGDSIVNKESKTTREGQDDSATVAKVPEPETKSVSSNCKSANGPDPRKGRGPCEGRDEGPDTNAAETTPVDVSTKNPFANTASTGNPDQYPSADVSSPPRRRLQTGPVGGRSQENSRKRTRQSTQNERKGVDSEEKQKGKIKKTVNVAGCSLSDRPRRSTRSARHDSETLIADSESLISTKPSPRTQDTKEGNEVYSSRESAEGDRRQDSTSKTASLKRKQGPKEGIGSQTRQDSVGSPKSKVLKSEETSTPGKTPPLDAANASGGSGKDNEATDRAGSKRDGESGRACTPSQQLKPASRVNKSSRKKRAAEQPTSEKGQEEGEANDATVYLLVTGGDILTRADKAGIKRLGMVLLDSEEPVDWLKVTHLLIDEKTQLKRTPKVMIAMCRATHFVTTSWLRQCFKDKKVLELKSPIDPRIRQSTESNKKITKASLDRANKMRSCGKHVLSDCAVALCKQVAGKKAPPLKELQSIVEAAGGEWLGEGVPKSRKKAETNHTIVITSDPPTRPQERALQSKGEGVIAKTTSWLFDTLMSQELVLE